MTRVGQYAPAHVQYTQCVHEAASFCTPWHTYSKDLRLRGQDGKIW